MKRCLLTLILAVCLLTALPAFAEWWMNSGKFGQVVYHNDIAHYVAENGTVSVNIEGPDMIWLRESSQGQTAWFGLDNSNGTFEEGSRFHVQWMSKEDGDWNNHYNNLDDYIQKSIEHLWMFELGVSKPDGTEIHVFDEPVSLYVQLGDNWDIDDLHACYINQGIDEKIVVNTMQSDEAGISGTLGVLSLTHFSPYAIYDTADISSAGQPPRTGDPADIVAWAALASLSMLGTLIMTYRWKKG